MKTKQRQKERGCNMRIEIPPFRAMAKCNEHLNHNDFTIGLGEDVIEVVRCKNCRHWNEYNTEENIGYCYIFGGYVKRNNYCSRAEKRGVI